MSDKRTLIMATDPLCRLRASPLCGGSAALGRVGNEYAATVMGDTVFREGESGGAKVLLEAVNRVKKETGDRSLIEVYLDSGVSLTVGPKILNGYSSLAKDHATLGKLLDAVADERTKRRPNEKNRFDYFRFTNVRDK